MVRRIAILFHTIVGQAQVTCKRVKGSLGYLLLGIEQLMLAWHHVQCISRHATICERAAGCSPEEAQARVEDLAAAVSITCMDEPVCLFPQRGP